MTAEWVRVELAAVEKYGADAAVVLGLIAYRCTPTGEWKASLEELIHETRLTERRVRSSLRVLRDTGAVQSRRADRFHPGLIWAVPAGHAVNDESSITRMPIRHSPENDNSAITSYREELPLVVPTAEPAPEPSKPRRRATSYPADFRPKPAHLELARGLGVNLSIEGPQFQDHHTAKGSTFKDWDAALRTWIRNAAKYAGTGPAAAAAPAPLPPRPGAYPASWGR